MISNRGLLLKKEFQEHLRKVYKKRLSYYPAGEIRFKYEHGKYRPYIKDETGLRYLAAEKASMISKLIDKKRKNPSGEFHKNSKIHKTPAGIVVRSKAELVIGTFGEKNSSMDMPILETICETMLR